MNDLDRVPSPREDVSEAFALAPLVSPALEPLFWPSLRIGQNSAWWMHVPFAHWLMSACAPRCFVELGTHAGVSYAAFCEAVLRGRLGTRCYAIDTWAGDAHAGQYGDQVFDELKTFHDERYAAFSEMVRSTFDAALPFFGDGSIDLLHIDGFHTYEAVRHDFETWRPKLSERAVVVFHDSNVKGRDFGVGRFLQELSEHYPAFEFLHGHGLAVVAVGPEAPAAVLDLCRTSGTGAAVAARERFAFVGARWLSAAREALIRVEYGKLEDRLRAAETDAAVARQAGADVAGARQAAEAEIARIRRQAGEEVAAARRAAEEEIAAVRAEARAQVESAAQAADAAVAEARRAAEAAERQRQIAAQRLKGLRRIVEFAGQETQHADDMVRHIGRRYQALLKASGTKTKDQASKIHHAIYFDAEWYLQQNADVAAAKLDPARHYLMHGAAEGRDPGPFFSSEAYLEANPDVRAGGLNPLLHYVEYGEAEGRKRRLQPPLPPAPRAVTDLGLGLGQAALACVFVSGEPDTPGHQYRVMRYVEAAQANGHRVSWVRIDHLPAKLDEIARNDVAVFWRVAWTETVADAYRRLRAAGCRIVFDVDDLMTEPDLATFETIDGIRSQSLTEDVVRAHYARVRQTMVAADLCFAATEELAFHQRWSGKVSHVLPNGFDRRVHAVSRLAARRQRAAPADGLLRIGYAGGTRTHQKDFGAAVEGIAAVLRAMPQVRLVLFRDAAGAPLVAVSEFPALAGLDAQIEWRTAVPLEELPGELARFDVNLAPLEFGNPYCEAKSELKFFEAALVDRPTVASPTGPFRRAIEHGRTGLLAASADDWFAHVKGLLEDPERRHAMARAAYRAALAAFGPEARARRFGCVLEQFRGGVAAARGFALGASLQSRAQPVPVVLPARVVFEHDALGSAEVTVIVPLYNYAGFIEETLDSVRAQRIETLDLVIVDDCSTDDSLAVATAWAKTHAARFNRILVLQNAANYGLGFCRNTGFDAAETPYVFPLDADNVLKPAACQDLVQRLQETGAAFAYSTIQCFGAKQHVTGNLPFEPQRLVAGNYIDAMALVSKEAWAMVGGVQHIQYGWEDFAFWCRMIEAGLRGEWVDKPLAGYRVHATSMMHTQTTVPENLQRLLADMKARHPWLVTLDQERSRQPPAVLSTWSPPAARTRLDRILPLLRCPATGQKLGYDGARAGLRTFDGLRAWPIEDGRAILTRTADAAATPPGDRTGPGLTAEAEAMIAAEAGLVLCLGAGDTVAARDDVVTADLAPGGRADVAADADALPFDDGAFGTVLAFDVFARALDPVRVAAELRRVLRPGGRLLIVDAAAPAGPRLRAEAGLSLGFPDLETCEAAESEAGFTLSGRRGDDPATAARVFKARNS